MSDLSVVLNAARKWRDEIDNYIEPDASEEEKQGYTDESDNISAAVEALEKRQPITVYFTGDEEGPNHFGTVYDTEDEAFEVAHENQLQVWRVAVVPDWDASVHLPLTYENDEEDDNE